MGVSERYLCKSRTLWYLQENRPPAPILCTYMGRNNKSTGKPFRFILNRSNATAANGFLMIYPKWNLFNGDFNNPKFVTFIWRKLNNLSADDITDEGRVYGGGLYKIEPKELGNLQIDLSKTHE